MKPYKNVMEDMVEEALESMKGQIEFCDCEQCHADIVALTLNHLPSQYAVTPPGASISKLMDLKAQRQADIQKELVKAIMIVNKDPRHKKSGTEKEDKK